jgi:hypothetical protein
LSPGTSFGLATVMKLDACAGLPINSTAPTAARMTVVRVLAIMVAVVAGLATDD